MSTEAAAWEQAPAASALHPWLARQVAEVRRLDPHVRSGQPDAVHEMRVALRRLRSVLATYRPLLERETTDPLRDELRWLGQQLGGARDSVVTHARLTDALKNEPPDTIRGPVHDRLDRDLRDRTERAHVAAVAAMGSDRYATLLERLDALAAAPPLTERAHQPVGEVLPARVRREWKRAKKRVALAGRAEDPAERAALLHEVRKASKRLRYATEPLVDVYGEDARRLVRAVERVQSELGMHHDSTVARAYLKVAADRAAAEGADTFTYGVLYGREEAAAIAAERAFDRAWAKASRKKLRTWLS